VGHAALPTSSYYGAALTAVFFDPANADRVTLQVTPLINPDGLVVMDISMQIDGLAAA